VNKIITAVHLAQASNRIVKHANAYDVACENCLVFTQMKRTMSNRQTRRDVVTDLTQIL